jgi:hypothetical protein
MGSHPADWKMVGGVHVRSTGWGHGDLGGAGAVVEARRRAVVDLPWTVLSQVHGARVVVVEGPGRAAGEAGDAAVSVAPGAAVAVLTADCAPVGLASPEGVFAVAHAGWKGLRAGVIEATVQAMRRLGATRVDAVLGPCVHSCCYAFGADELSEMVTRFGAQVRSADRSGAPSLDLPASVQAAVHVAGAQLVGDAAACTSCRDGYWSWRADRTQRRQATVVWKE